MSHQRLLHALSSIRCLERGLEHQAASWLHAAQQRLSQHLLGRQAAWQASHSAALAASFTAGAGSINAGANPGADSSTRGPGGVEPPASLGFVRGGYDVADFPPERVRNFSVIAHVDHGKSTLADRLMQMTGAVPQGARAQYLDRLQVERERGITVKAQTVTLVYHPPGNKGCAAAKPYLLNLVDTPGHVDFSYEVSRSLAACQGALLLVDASQGVQAQTVANFYLAFEQGLALVPLLNKVDLPSADPQRALAQMLAAFDMAAPDVLHVSAKTGQGMEAVLPAIVDRIPPPAGRPDGPLRLLLFDAYHDPYRGVVCLVAVVDGVLEAGGKLLDMSSGQQHEALEVGVMAPEPHPTGALRTGQVGYVITGIKDMRAVRVGATWHAPRAAVQELPGFKPVTPMVFAGLYPASGDEYDSLAAALERLALNDASVTMRKETSDALGAGFRCGFLGPLHLDVFLQRLAQEFGAEVVSTAPTVPYEVQVTGEGERRRLDSAAAWPRDKKVVAVYEPTVTATILVPAEQGGAVMTLCAARRGEALEQSYLGSEGVGARGGCGSGGEGGAGGGEDGGGGGKAGVGSRLLLRWRLPLSELAGDFYSRLKSLTHGYASLDYEDGPLRQADLVLLELLVNGKSVDALARLVHSSEAARAGRSLLTSMKQLLDRQQFEVVLQAAANGRVVARETLKAVRKDVLAKCYGGDISRKRKLLDKQREGKKRMRRLGALQVPADVFPQLLRAWAPGAGGK